MVFFSTVNLIQTSNSSTQLIANRFPTFRISDPGAPERCYFAPLSILKNKNKLSEKKLLTNAERIANNEVESVTNVMNLKNWPP